MVVRQTSIDSFRDLVESDKLGCREQVVLEAFRICVEGTDREITFFLGFSDPNMVRPRRNALVEKGFISEAGKDYCFITGKRVIVWAYNFVDE